MLRKNIEYKNKKYLYVTTKQYGIVGKSKIYVSSQRDNGDGRYYSDLLNKTSVTWYFAAIVIPICFLIYLFTCVGLGLIEVCYFRFDSVFDKTTYGKATNNFIDMLDGSIRPTYSSCYPPVFSDKPLNDNELVIKAKKVLHEISL